jgi:S-adenosylmethionine uptake transporter
LLKERVGRSAVVASGIALAGVAVIFTGQARADLGPDATTGSIAILGSAVCYAWNIVLMRQQALVARPVEIAFFQSAIVAVLFLLAAPMFGAVPDARHAPMLVLAAILATASLMLLSWAYARGEASYLAPSEYTSFIWASLFGWIVFSESLSLYTLAGAALIICGCVLSARAAPPMESAL